jgi:pyruvate dehydrogenase E2 component (dihydrolipoamide acetyltransferase)
MATKVHLEALSPTMEEGQLVKWVKAEGDSVSTGDVLAEIETDKATMELVARGDGVLRIILLGEGDTAPVGEVIAVIAGADEDISAVVLAVAAISDSSEPAPEAREVALFATEVPSVGDSHGVASPEEAIQEGAAGPDAAAAQATEEDGRVKASPLARRLAAEAGLDLGRIRGSGPAGRIVKGDVEAAMAGAVDLSSPGGGTVADSVERTVADDWLPPDPGEDFEDVPLSQMRKTIAKRLVESLGPVPHFFLRITVDMERTLEARKRINGLLKDTGEKVSINDFILKATAHALSKHPRVNAQWTGDAIRRHHRVHLGVAVAVEDGLITPVIRDANRKGLAQISREMGELAARGKEKKLLPEEYTGATFSVSNLGMFGIHEFTGVINPPEAGILAVGGVEETPVSEDGRVVVKPLMKVTMSCDHRVIDGATGARFLQTLREMLEEPAAVLI